jgi:[ribosomal protein S5]-alanine N-acetyltransferase
VAEHARGGDRARAPRGAAPRRDGRPPVAIAGVPSLRTARLVLRPFRPEDADDQNRLIDSDPEVVRWLGDGRTRGLADTREAIERIGLRWRELGFGVWAVRDAADGAHLGHCGLKPLPGSEDVEVLYALARTAWGRGYATEAAAAALRFGFGPAGLTRIVAVTYPENAGSRRVLAKVGMREDGPARVYGVDVVMHSLERDAFRPDGPYELIPASAA